MSYDHRYLFEAIYVSLHEKPCSSLGELSKRFRLSRRTIQNTVADAAQKTFREFREDLLIEKVRRTLLSQPMLAIKELSSTMGYRYARSFARAVRRASGSCPVQLRSSVVTELLDLSNGIVGVENRAVGSRNLAHGGHAQQDLL